STSSPAAAGTSSAFTSSSSPSATGSRWGTTSSSTGTCSSTTAAGSCSETASPSRITPTSTATPTRWPTPGTWKRRAPCSGRAYASRTTRPCSPGSTWRMTRCSARWPSRRRTCRPGRSRSASRQCRSCTSRPWRSGRAIPRRGTRSPRSERPRRASRARQARQRGEGLVVPYDQQRVRFLEQVVGRRHDVQLIRQYIVDRDDGHAVAFGELELEERTTREFVRSGQFLEAVARGDREVVQEPQGEPRRQPERGFPFRPDDLGHADLLEDLRVLGGGRLHIDLADSDVLEREHRQDAGGQV